jgi:hypothetical protein
LVTAAESRKKSKAPRGRQGRNFCGGKDGATTAEMAKATDWQSHTIRAFLSADVAKKMGPGVESVKK